jgi:colanic acid/amylovoran biosynthesis glycosyltransferase
VSSRKTLRLAIFSRSKDSASETFIKAHIERLPFVVLPFYTVFPLAERFWYVCDAKSRRLWPWGGGFGWVAQKLAPKLNAAAFNYLLARHLRGIRADAVLAEYGTTGAYLVEGCKKARLPLFVHFFGSDASIRTLLAANQDAYRNMFDYASGIVAVSNAMKNRLLALGAPPERLHLNPCGADPRSFSGGSPETQGPVFLAVGRFVEKKAPYLTVLAFGKMLKAVPAARLIMVGEGPLLGPCKRLAAALDAGAAIEFPGVQSPGRVNELLRQARAFVQHSLEADNGDCEGTPVAVIEAQMAGVPVVSTRHAGIPDVVADGETGYLVAEGDANGMSTRMEQLARDPGLAGRMGRAARLRAEARYTLDQHLRQLAEMIEAACPEK